MWSLGGDAGPLSRHTPRIVLIHRGPPHPGHADDIEGTEAFVALTGGTPWDDWGGDHPAEPCPAFYCIRDPSSSSATA